MFPLEFCHGSCLHTKIVVGSHKMMTRCNLKDRKSQHPMNRLFRSARFIHMHAVQRNLICALVTPLSPEGLHCGLHDASEGQRCCERFSADDCLAAVLIVYIGGIPLSLDVAIYWHTDLWADAIIIITVPCCHKRGAIKWPLRRFQTTLKHFNSRQAEKSHMQYIIDYNYVQENVSK